MKSRNQIENEVDSVLEKLANDIDKAGIKDEDAIRIFGEELIEMAARVRAKIFKVDPPKTS